MSGQAPRHWRLGYSTAGFSRTPDLARVFAQIRAAGFEAVEISVGPPHLPTGPELVGQAAAVRRALDAEGLDAVVGAGARHALGPVPHEPALASSDPAERAHRLVFVERCLDFAAGAGIALVTLHSGPLPAGQAEEAGWRAMVEGLRSLRARAERLGRGLTLEWHPAMLVDDLRSYRRASREAGPLPLTLDVGHVRCTEDAPLADVIRDTLVETVYVQLEDIRGRRHVHLPVGEGEIPFGEVFRALDGAGYSGLVCAEFHSGSIDRPEDALCRDTARRLVRFLAP